ncbi:hypothetical protein QBC33DRAFT_590608 [Phialemonium atrogriseum]|uniref:AB hydrolase-1 domain-containing protein n=1 Tax=Phialemonium atrogriseum TaxID=1093897 RepID=A0AAJ0BWU7_9PEZI|nr:uncharacterized protein QBC33DRAFT_590608 [Phialemonium atrogriseum]KAK1765760.1 hypothetical protein QBC33DRAFT_590608 [Phialemonium atrogriseum]
MKKTLLLCFIHGFKGGDSTFGDNYAFTEHLRQLVAKQLPKVDVKVLVYPKYETRGDLGDCVERFRDWLLEKVIDLEVAAGTSSPTIDPSVHTVLVGHSMGGIVAAETVIALTSDRPVHGSTDPANDDLPEAAAAAAAPPPRPRSPTPNSLMFPYVRGVLAFDTPFLGVSPGVVAHGAEGHYATASSAISQLGGIAGIWGAAGAANKAATPPPARAALPAPAGDKDKDRPASPWARWGKVAMVAGAVGAVAAGGAAAYMNREQITSGLGWVSSHLEFVGCLGRKEELRRRVAYMVRLNRDVGVGFGNIYTRLGKAAGSRTANGVVGTVLGSERTFCVVPRKDEAGEWRVAVNDAATDETLAHMSMFTPRDNPGYARLASDATQLITQWVRNDWYESSSQDAIAG